MTSPPGAIRSELLRDTPQPADHFSTAHHVLSVAWLEYDQLPDGGRIEPARLGPGESTTIGGHRLTVSPGVTVRVKTSGDGFCVRGSNQYGDTTTPQCGDTHTKPLELGTLGSLS